LAVRDGPPPRPNAPGAARIQAGEAMAGRSTRIACAPLIRAYRS
jgi:hypothetical protein